MVVVLVLAAMLGCAVGTHPVLQKLGVGESVLQNELTQALHAKASASIADALENGKSVDYGANI